MTTVAIPSVQARLWSGLLKGLSRLFASKPLLELVAFDKVLDYLADRYLPLGVELTAGNRSLLNRAFQEARRRGDVQLKNLSDVVAVFRDSECRCVREFAGHCSIPAAQDRSLAAPEFEMGRDTRSATDRLVEGGSALFTIAMEFARYAVGYVALFTFGWILVIGAPLFGAILSPSTPTDALGCSLSSALGVAEGRWAFFAHAQVLQATFAMALLMGMVRLWLHFARHEANRSGN